MCVCVCVSRAQPSHRFLERFQGVRVCVVTCREKTKGKNTGAKYSRSLVYMCVYMLHGQSRSVLSRFEWRLLTFSLWMFPLPPGALVLSCMCVCVCVCVCVADRNPKPKRQYTYIAAWWRTILRVREERGYRRYALLRELQQDAETPRERQRYSRASHVGR